jgi:hypothetical protein
MDDGAIAVGHEVACLDEPVSASLPQEPIRFPISG